MIWDGETSDKGSKIQVWLTTSFLVHSRGSLLALLKTLAADSTNLWITSAGIFEVAAATTSFTVSSLSRISVAPLAGMAMLRELKLMMMMMMMMHSDDDDDDDDEAEDVFSCKLWLPFEKRSNGCFRDRILWYLLSAAQIFWAGFTEVIYLGSWFLW